MKTLIALIAYVLAVTTEHILKPKEVLISRRTVRPSELTEEIRRYDIADLILP